MAAKAVVVCRPTGGAKAAAEASKDARIQVQAFIIVLGVLRLPLSESIACLEAYLSRRQILARQTYVDATYVPVGSLSPLWELVLS
jgi:hypothetical protein